MTSSIYLFPDTNVLLQCKALQEIDWHGCDALTEFDTIHLLVSLPVMNEIDKLKSRGNDRLGRRARKANGMIRELVLSDNEQRVIKQTEPTVTFAEMTSIQPTPDLLDYDISDNRILGCVDAYRHVHRDRDVRFLTHDTGAMATARNQGIPLVPVPDDWLLDPEPSAAERRVAELETEVRLLKQTEPQVDIQFLDSAEEKIEKIVGECLAARSLKDTEITQFLEELQNSVRYSRNRDWLEHCQEHLQNLHTSIQHRSQRVSVLIEARNNGTRPAKDVLIEIIGHGPILLGVPLDDDDDFLREYRQRPIQLPSPPKITDTTIHLPHVPDLDGRRDRTSRDPNDFYYKPGRPDEPVSMIAFECQQWRHESGTEDFLVDIYVDSELPEIKGTIECLLHAENLSKPVRKVLQVKLKCQPVDTAERAAQLVEQTVQQARADLASYGLDEQFGRRTRG